MHSTKAKTIALLACIAALLYSSWPLGYILNPRVAHVSLASGLEAVHQPYNWVFVLADVISSAVILVVCYLLWSSYKATHARQIIAITLICTSLFAVGTIVDALLPERCVPNLMACPSFTQDHTLLFHGIFSILASVCLFGALFVVWLKNLRNITLSMLLTGYIAFGIMSLMQAIIPRDKGNWSQDYYMALCSLWVLLLPYAIGVLAKVRVRKLQPAR
jgi:lipoprotein signal peptidase